jgi:transcriptional regulator with XRE-family HTH domain
VDELEARRYLGELIKQRRMNLGLSLQGAAKKAGVARNTWTGAEAGARTVRSYRWSVLERVLEWAPGSIAAILAGGAPTLAPEEEDTVPPEIPIILDRLRDPAVPEREKWLTRELLRMIVRRESGTTRAK